jgi:transcriptional antiterminator RfaH
MSWYVVKVRAGRELATAELLQNNLQLKVYVPEVMQSWRGKTQLQPLFPGYLFVHGGCGRGALAQIDVTPGCGRLVRFDSGTAHTDACIAVGDDDVRLLRARVLQLNQSGGLPAYHLHPGDPVEITAGPMQGVNALLLRLLPSTARVQVLLHFLGREQKVTVAMDSVTPCAPAQKGTRRTRGHGRYIGGAQRAAKGAAR